MDHQSAVPNLGMKVVQGVILGIVLSIPVVLWALSRAAAFQESPAGQNPVAATDTAAPARAVSKPGNAAASSAAARKRVQGPQGKRDEYVTVPPSQMHLRIDNGSRPASNAAQQSIEANEE
jgi:hypothetical protein